MSSRSGYGSSQGHDIDEIFLIGILIGVGIIFYFVPPVRVKAHAFFCFMVGFLTIPFNYHLGKHSFDVGIMLAKYPIGKISNYPISLLLDEIKFNSALPYIRMSTFAISCVVTYLLYKTTRVNLDIWFNEFKSLQLIKYLNFRYDLNLTRKRGLPYFSDQPIERDKQKYLKEFRNRVKKLKETKNLPLNLIIRLFPRDSKERTYIYSGDFDVKRVEISKTLLIDKENQEKQKRDSEEIKKRKGSSGGGDSSSFSKETQMNNSDNIKSREGALMRPPSFPGMH